MYSFVLYFLLSHIFDKSGSQLHLGTFFSGTTTMAQLKNWNKAPAGNMQVKFLSFIKKKVPGLKI